MTKPNNPVELGELDWLESLVRVTPGINIATHKTREEFKQAIQSHLAEEVRKAVYGFHEFIIGKDIIQQETDQAFNYARLHRALDAYIAELTPNKESEQHGK